MSKTAYITVGAPFGRQETFITTEMLALKRLGAEILIAPRDDLKGVFNMDAEPLVKDTLRYPLFSALIALSATGRAIKNPIPAFHIIKDIVLRSGGAKKALKNMAVAPKAFFLSGLFEGKGITHMHAHWATTTSTMAHIISRLTGIPWSMTCHRGDIQENNLMAVKCQSASFVRAIDEPGRSEIIGLAGAGESLRKKIFVLHMGVDLPELKTMPRMHDRNTLAFICPANLIPKKGHRYLIEACKILSTKGIDYRCIIAGDGPLEHELRKTVMSLNLSDRIEFAGRVPNEKLLGMYADRAVSLVVLPSINTEDSQREGIPVALMEAMAYGIPVVSTDTGGIPELIGDGSGIMIGEKDPSAIAEAVMRLATDRSFYERLALKGRKKIENEFNGKKTAQALIRLFNSHDASRRKENQNLITAKSAGKARQGK